MGSDLIVLSIRCSEEILACYCSRFLSYDLIQVKRTSLQRMRKRSAFERQLTKKFSLSNARHRTHAYEFFVEHGPCLF